MDAEERYADSEQGFWHSRPDDEFPPLAIERVADYRGAERLSLACTQTGRSDVVQRRILREWCEALPRLSRVRFLWFQTRVPQVLFDAACQLPALEGLYIKWSGVKELAALRQPKRLTYLHIGHSSRVSSLEPIPQLRQLRWLELDGIKTAADLESLARLRHLQGLRLTGTEFKRQAVPSFAPLRALQHLVWLNLGALRSDDGSLAPLGDLKALRWLHVANLFTLEEFAALSLRLPDTRCPWFEPHVSLTGAFQCTECRKAHRVLTAGRPGRILCPRCDERKFESHMKKWRQAIAAAGGAKQSG